MLTVLKAVNRFLGVRIFNSYQWQYNLAIRVGLKVVWVLQLLAQDPVIVYLTIDCER